MSKSENIRFNVYLNDAQAGNTMGGLYKQSRQLRSEISKLEIGSKEWIAKMREIRQVNGDLQKVRSEINGTNSAWSKMANGFNKYFSMFTAGIAAITGIVFSLKEWIQGNVGLSDSIADVMKTTQLSRREVQKMYTDFKQFDTRTPRKELLALAEEAGRLGKKSSKDILDFVEVANQIKVALGDDLGGNAEEAIREVGKLTNIFKVAEKYGTDFKKSMLMVGSAINEVSANSQAQAGYLIGFTKRLSGLADQANIDIDKIIGMAAALDELGQSQEMSATAVNKVLIDMFTDVETYAGIAHMSVADFSNLLQTDANEALLKFLEGLNGNNDGLTVMGGKLDALGLDGARAIQVLASLASNTELVRKQQDIANDSLEKGTSLTQEYNIKNENLAGNVEKIGRKIQAWFINSTLLSWLEKSVSYIANFGKETKTATDLIRGYYTEMRNERSQLDLLFTSLEKAGEGTNTRKNAIEKINEIYGEYLSSLLTEKSTTEEIAIAYKEANKGLVQNITLKARENDMQVLVNESLANQKEIMDEILNDVAAKKGENAAAVAMGEIFDIVEQMKKAQTKEEIKDIVGSFARRYRDANKNVGTYAENLQQFVGIMRLQITEQKELNKVTLFYDQLMKQLGIVKPETKTPENRTPKPTTQTGPSEEYLKKAEELRDKLMALQHEAELRQMGDNEREIQLIRDKYQTILDDAVGHDEQIRELERLRDEEIALKQEEQEARYAEKKQSAIDELAKYQMDGMEEELWAADEAYRGLIDLAEQYGIDTTEIIQKYEAQKAAIRDKYREEDVMREKKAQQQKTQMQLQAAMGTAQVFGNVFGVMSSMMDEHSEEYKDMMIAQAYMNAISSAIAAYNSASAIPYVGWILGPVAAAAALTFGLAQVAEIQSTESYGKGGVAQGASHSKGGIHMIDSQSGRKVGEMEGGEPYMILSKDTYANNRDVVDALLDSSMNRGGEAVDWMQPGYYKLPDVDAAVRNLNTSRFAKGTVTNVNNVYNQQTPNPPSGDTAALYSKMNEVLDELKNLKSIKAFIDMDGTLELKQALADVDTLEKEAGV